METNQYFDKPYFCADDVKVLKSDDRYAVVLDEGRPVPNPYSEKKTDFAVTLQITSTKQIKPIRLNYKSWVNLKTVLGSDSVKWRGAVVRMDVMQYKTGSEGVVLSVFEKPKSDEVRKVEEMTFNQIASVTGGQ